MKELKLSISLINKSLFLIGFILFFISGTATSQDLSRKERRELRKKEKEAERLAIEEEEREYLFEETLKPKPKKRGKSLVQADDAPVDEALAEVEDDLEEIVDSAVLAYIPKVTMELLSDRLSCVENEIPLTLNNKVASFIDYFTVRNSKYTVRMLQKKDYYFPLFERKLKEHGLPDELKYLAIVESGLSHSAISRAGAGGLWQFMVGTGRMFGLNQTPYLDDRFDPELSTEAACKYLKYLYNFFGDWELALASYNAGPGRVRGAQRKTGKKKFWDIYHALPAETRAYVPQFVAVTYAMNYAELHNLHPHPDSMMVDIPNLPVSVNKSVNLERIAEHYEMDVTQLRVLNPTLRKPITPNTGTYYLRMPKAVAEDFMANNEALTDSFATTRREMVAQVSSKGYAAAAPKGGRRVFHRVRRGENLSLIANRYKVNVSDVKGWNRLRSNTVMAGQKLVIYQQGAPAPVLAKSSPVKPGNSKTYIVQPGDTLWSISQKHDDLTLQDLINKNNLRDKKIIPGQKLIVG